MLSQASPGHPRRQRAWPWKRRAVVHRFHKVESTAMETLGGTMSRMALSLANARLALWAGGPGRRHLYDQRLAFGRDIKGRSILFEAGKKSNHANAATGTEL